MKKLFSIALVIAMAVSCLAIFPSATISADTTYTFTYAFNGDILTLTATLDGQFTDTNLANAFLDMYFYYDEAEIVPNGDKTTAVITGVAADGVGVCQYAEDGSFGATISKSPRDAEGNVLCSISFDFKVLAAPGETITITDDESCAGCDDDILYWTEFDANNQLTITVPAATEEPEEPTYEAPAAASYQTLAGCEVCGTAAGVRFIAEVDAAADEYGMYITANGKTVTLSSANADFVAKEVTDTTVTFTAVIFSDMTFEVVVFEKYGDTEVTSTVGTN